MKHLIHINQHVIKKNAKDNADSPVITVKTYKSNDYCHEVIIRDESGKEVARVVYDGTKLACGARCWVETDLEVELVTR